MSRAAPALLVVMALLPSPGRAQSDEAQPRYQALIADALRELEADNHAEARALFIQAHRIVPSARTLRGIGMTSFTMRDYAGAYRALGESLESTTHPLDERLRAQVQILRERARAFVALVDVTLEPPGAALEVDAVPTASRRLVLGLGEHSLVAREGAREDRRAFAVRGGETIAITLEIATRSTETPTTSTPAALTPAVAPVSPEVSDLASPSVADPTVAIALMVAGGTALAGAIAAAGFWAERHVELERCGDGSCRGRTAAERERDVAIGLTIGSLGLALLLGALGVAVYPWETPEEGACRCGPAGCISRF